MVIDLDEREVAILRALIANVISNLKAVDKTRTDQDRAPLYKERIAQRKALLNKLRAVDRLAAIGRQ